MPTMLAATASVASPASSPVTCDHHDLLVHYMSSSTITCDPWWPGFCNPCWAGNPVYSRLRGCDNLQL
jgi:hypothetical protein